MRYPTWAPKDVVDFYESSRVSIATERANLPSATALRHFAVSNGFPSFKVFDACTTQKLEMLGRLVTRREMQAVWKWLVPRHEKMNPTLPIAANGGLIGTFLRDIDTWYCTDRRSKSNRRTAWEEIARDAKALARKVEKTQGEVLGLPPLFSFISEEAEPRLKKLLHPDLTAAFLARYHRAQFRPVLDSILPTLVEVLDRLSALARQQDPGLPPKFPRKIGAGTAFRTYLVRCCADGILSRTAEFSPTIVATFASVALDDANINADLVLKITNDLPIVAWLGQIEDSIENNG